MTKAKDNKNIRIYLRSGVDLRLPSRIIAHIEMPNVSIFGHYTDCQSRAIFKKEKLSGAICRFNFKEIKKKDIMAF